jgi:hypothetical protein
MDKPAGIFPKLGLGLLPPSEVAGVGEVRMHRLVGPRSLGIVRPGPTLAPVVQVAHGVEILLPARRARVERLARI